MTCTDIHTPYSQDEVDELRKRLARLNYEHGKAERTLGKILLNRHPSALGRKKHLMDQLHRLETERERVSARLECLTGEPR